MLQTDEPLKDHTTFAIGGPADFYLEPKNTEEMVAAVRFAHGAGLPFFILGGGANVLVADKGVRGLVINTASFKDIRVEGNDLIAESGAPISDASARAAEAGLGGLAFLYSMPGSTGGAVWMNARCYGHSIFDILGPVECVTRDGSLQTYQPRGADFDYKKSPFQDNKRVILSVRFRLTAGDKKALWEEMAGYEEDRRQKGHFSAPSAGSVFKNNRSFGAPTGRLIDSLGLRGYRVGDAKISDQHANIFVNAGGATADDMRRLIEHVEEQVQHQLGFRLEREVLFVGDWDDSRGA